MPVVGAACSPLGAAMLGSGMMGTSHGGDALQVPPNYLDFARSADP